MLGSDAKVNVLSVARPSKSQIRTKALKPTKTLPNQVLHEQNIDLVLDPMIFSTTANSTNIFGINKFGADKEAANFESLNLLTAENGCLSFLDTMINTNAQSIDFSLIKDNQSLFEENINFNAEALEQPMDFGDADQMQGLDHQQIVARQYTDMQIEEIIIQLKAIFPSGQVSSIHHIASEPAAEGANSNRRK